MKKIIKLTIWSFLLALVFTAGFYLNELTRPSIEKIEGLTNKRSNQTQNNKNIDFGLFWDAWYLIEKNYAERGDLENKNMVNGAIAGLVKSLDDPYSVYMEPKEKKKFMDNMSGSFEGIGAEVGIRDNILTIISPLPDNPAERSGLEPGDKILEINGSSTQEFTLDEAVTMIRGEKGTTVKLLISREGWDDFKEIKVTRDEIKIPIIEFEMKEDNVAHIQLRHFTQNSPVEFRNIMQKALNKKAQGLVLDLRNNPGGYLGAAVDIASWFLEKGSIVAIEDFGNGKTEEYRSVGYENLKKFPTTILINKGSASASEILAGALKNKESVTIVGETSFGKGSVQEMQSLKNGGSIKLTIAKWLTPEGTSISEKGIVPEVEVKLTEEDAEQANDRQLEKALELLKN